MTHAEVCPICNGTGRVPIIDNDWVTTGKSVTKTCHGCGGKGWVIVEDYHYEFPREWTYPPPLTWYT